MESLENQYKVFLKTLHIFNYDRFPDFDWLFNWDYLTNLMREKRSATFIPGAFITCFFQ